MRGRSRRWRPDAVSMAIDASTPSAVIPANAGIHNHREEFGATPVTPSLRQTPPCGYGSRIFASLVRDDTISVATSILTTNVKWMGRRRVLH
ncbi:hypothetical protein GA0061098_101758 [Bradyrhizobium shewense]|uniref:Uncharacterized protein n=1 Tax=Bradyrhizobium shewense TaxID=1761772 RepID=A0A1C3XK52_9BRAD|nr:hypothetical protein GA0061098_101758 [Bradyrhizobium shewense]